VRETVLDLAVDEIWRYGADSAQIPGRLAAMLKNLKATARPKYQPSTSIWSGRIAARLADSATGGPGRVSSGIERRTQNRTASSQ